MTSSPLQNRMRLSQLRLLVHIAQAGSLQAAAQQLHMSQPAATKSLRLLEQAAGAPLVLRAATGSVLTDAGQLMCRHARIILAELRTIEEELGMFHAGTAGQVVVGALPVAAPVLIPFALRDLARDYPQINVRVVEGTSDSLFTRLKEGQLDLLVGRFWPSEEPAFVNEFLFDSRFALAARTGHPLSGRKKLRLDEVMEWPWILPPPGAHSRSALEAMFMAASAPPPLHSIETSSYQIIRSLLLTTDMLCPLPIETLQEDAAQGKLQLLPVLLDVRLPPVGVVRLAHRAPSPAANTVLAILRKAAQATLEQSPRPAGQTRQRKR